MVGWGFVHPYDRIVATRLQAMQMQAMTNARCWMHHQQYNMSHWVTPEMVCLEAFPGQGVCGKFHNIF